MHKEKIILSEIMSHESNNSESRYRFSDDAVDFDILSQYSNIEMLSCFITTKKLIVKVDNSRFVEIFHDNNALHFSCLYDIGGILEKLKNSNFREYIIPIAKFKRTKLNANTFSTIDFSYRFLIFSVRECNFYNYIQSGENIQFYINFLFKVLNDILSLIKYHHGQQTTIDDYCLIFNKLIENLNLNIKVVEKEKGCPT